MKNKYVTTQRLVRIALFTMLTIIGGLIKIPIPGTPVMFTLQTFFVIMSGLFLGAKDGAASQIIYLIMGLIGIPIFTKGGGFWYVFEPSFGYLATFFIGAFLTGYFKSKLKTISHNKLFICCVLGLSLIYIFGMIYQVLILWLYLKWEFTLAIASLVSMPVLLVIDMIMFYVLCIIYPKVLTIIGDPSSETGNKKNNELKAMSVENEKKKTVLSKKTNISDYDKQLLEEKEIEKDSNKILKKVKSEVASTVIKTKPSGEKKV